jgi:hypothetical protein
LRAVWPASDANTYCHSKPNSNADSDSHAYSDAHCNSNSYSYIHSYAHSDAYSNSYSDIYPYTYSNPNADSHTDAMYRQMFTDAEAATDVVGATYSATSSNAAADA